MKYSISFEDFLNKGIICCKSMMRAGRFGEKQPHWIPFIAKCRLNTYEDITILFPIYQKIFSICIQIARGFSPILLQCCGIGSQILVLANTHFVSNSQIWAAELSFFVMNISE